MTTPDGATPQHQTRYCSWCGAQHSADARYCPACGHAIKADAQVGDTARPLAPQPNPATSPTSFILASGNRLGIDPPTFRIEDPNGVELLSIPTLLIASTKRNLAELLVTRSTGETVSLTFQTLEDASRAESLLSAMGVHSGAASGWSTGYDHGGTPPRSVVNQFGIGCAVLLGICMLLGLVSAIVDGGTVSSINSASEPGSTSNVSGSAYRAEIMSQSDELGRSMTRYSILLQNPQLFSDTWRQNVTTELAIWRSTYRDAAALSAPDEFAAFHTSYLAALAEFDAAADKVERGLNTMDPDLMDAASDDITQGTTLIDEAMSAIPN